MTAASSERKKMWYLLSTLILVGGWMVSSQWFSGWQFTVITVGFLLVQVLIAKYWFWGE